MLLSSPSPHGGISFCAIFGVGGGVGLMPGFTFLALHRPASATNATSGSLANTCIGFVVKMALWAMSFLTVAMVGRIVGTSHVFSMSESAKVVRIYAGRVIAAMINFSIKGNPTNEMLIGGAVRQHCDVDAFENAVAASVPICGPFPAATTCDDVFSSKAFKAFSIHKAIVAQYWESINVITALQTLGLVKQS